MARVLSFQRLYQTTPPLIQNSSTAGWQQVDTSKEYQFLLSQVNAGQSGTVIFAVILSTTIPTGFENLSNHVIIANDGLNGADPTPANNSASKLTPVDAAPDLVINISDDGVSTSAGAVVVYRMTVINNGTQTATGVEIVEDLPLYTSYYSSDSSEGWLSSGSGQYTYAVGDLAVGNTAMVEFAVRVSNYLNASVTELQNSVLVRDDGTNGTDINLADNTASEATPVQARPMFAPTPFATPTAMPALEPTNVPGDRQPVISVPAIISSDTTWVNGSVYVITGVATLNSGITLTIDPGAIVKFQNNGTTKGKLVVNGILLANGTVSNQIIFTSIHDDSFGGDTNQNNNATRPSAGDWDNVTIASTGNGSIFTHTLFRYGGNVEANLLVNGASVSMSYSTSQWSANDGVRWTAGASGTIANNQFYNNLRYGIALLSSSLPAVNGNLIAFTRSYAIWMEGSSPAAFTTNTVYGNGYNAIGVTGTLASGTWTSNVPYVVTQNLTLDSSGVLKLEPGSVVKFLANTNLVMRGTLIAEGAEIARNRIYLD